MQFALQPKQTSGHSRWSLFLFQCLLTNFMNYVAKTPTLIFQMRSQRMQA